MVKRHDEHYNLLEDWFVDFQMRVLMTEYCLELKLNYNSDQFEDSMPNHHSIYFDVFFSEPTLHESMPELLIVSDSRR